MAGLGTRFLPATKSVPKEIMTLVDRPLIQYAIDEARAAGIREFIFVHLARQVRAGGFTSITPPNWSRPCAKKGKTDLLEMLKSTNMDFGRDRLYPAKHKALGLGARRVVRAAPAVGRTLCRHPAR